MHALIEVPILCDSFSWTTSQRSYPMYKRELCAIVSFVRKYDYFAKHSYLPAILHTDHKSLTHFLTSDIHEGIYDHWADELHRLNVSIFYVSRHQNKVADGLSRILFKIILSSHSSQHNQRLPVDTKNEREKEKEIWYRFASWRQDCSKILMVLKNLATTAFITLIVYSKSLFYSPSFSLHYQSRSNTISASTFFYTIRPYRPVPLKIILPIEKGFLTACGVAIISITPGLFSSGAYCWAGLRTAS